MEEVDNGHPIVAVGYVEEGGLTINNILLREDAIPVNTMPMITLIL